MLGSGLLVLATRVLPRWLGWVAVAACPFFVLQAFGLGGVVSSFGLTFDLIGFLLFLIFVLASSVIGLTRAPSRCRLPSDACPARSTATQNQSCAQTCCAAAAADDDVVGGRHRVTGHPPGPIGDYAASAAICADGSWRGTRRSACVQLGIHQFQSPISRMSAGTSRARMTVASRMIPAPTPIASGLTS
jgi:hypothetical protein